VTETTSDIFDLKDSPAKPPLLEPPLEPDADSETETVPVVNKKPRPSSHWISPIPHFTAHTITWLVIAFILCAGAVAAFHEGMNLRTAVWQSTRTIRFKDDIFHGYDWGCQTLRFAERVTHLDERADALADQSPAVLRKINRPDLIGKHTPTFRRLTYTELIAGIVHYCDNRVLQSPEGEYDLDYPPLRLAAMTLWARHVQRKEPLLDQFPIQRMEDTSLRQPEDVAEPMLRFNAYCTATAAIAMFFLVWLWMWRDAKARGVLLPPDEPRWRWTLPHGMIAFLVATFGFWFALLRVAQPPPHPAPEITLSEIHSHDDHAAAVIILNTQRQNTQWRVDFGPSDLYGQSTPWQYASDAPQDQPVMADIYPTAAQGLTHFRVVARNNAGVTLTDDFSFNHNDANPQIQSPTFGGAQWPTMSVWFRLLALFVIMVVSARLLPQLHRGWACGAVAALLLWFNPMEILVSDAWPQWDAWVLAAFLVAALLASLECWLLAGVVLGIGIMFKGQVALGGPILLLWPLFAGRFGPFLRALIGVALGAALVTWPWIVTTPQAVHWIESVLLAAAIILAASFLRPRLLQAFSRWIWDPLTSRANFENLLSSDPDRLLSPAAVDLIVIGLAVCSVTLAAWIIFHGVAHAAAPFIWPKLLLLMVALAPWLLPRRATLYWLVATFAASAWISTCLFPASWSWLTLGFEYGSVKHDQMQMSIRSLANLTTILARSYNWDIHDLMGTLRLSFATPGPWTVGHWFTIPSIRWSWSQELDVKQTMTLLYAICLVIASAAAAIHARRKDPRILAALIAPWAVFPVVMCQMGDRYLIWIAALSAGMVAISLGMTFLHVIVTLLASAMMMNHLLTYDETRWPAMKRFLEPTFPGIAWLTIALAALFLINACIPSKHHTRGLPKSPLGTVK
jgi:hypothetical protein